MCLSVVNDKNIEDERKSCLKWHFSHSLSTWLWALLTLSLSCESHQLFVLTLSLESWFVQCQCSSGWNTIKKKRNSPYVYKRISSSHFPTFTCDIWIILVYTSYVYIEACTVFVPLFQFYLFERSQTRHADVDINMEYLLRRRDISRPFRNAVFNIKKKNWKFEITLWGCKINKYELEGTLAPWSIK